jgi:serine/threonine protein kinase
MIDDNHSAKLADFGLTAHESPCGTKTYMAPELFEVTQRDKIDWLKADAWSLGIVIF